MITKKNKEKLKDFINFSLSDLDNKIVSYKNDNVKIPTDKLKDFMSCDIHLFIPNKMLKNNFNIIKEKVESNILYLITMNVKWIDYNKLINVLEEMKKDDEWDKVLLLNDNSKNIFRLYIKVLPPTAYNYDDISFVINITDDIIQKNNVIDEKVNPKQDMLKLWLTTRIIIIIIIIILVESLKKSAL